MSDDANNDGTTKKIGHLPLVELGFRHVPAVPVQLLEMIDTALKLGIRYQEIQLPVDSLTTPYTIGGQTAFGYQFCFGRAQTKATARETALEDLLKMLETHDNVSVLTLVKDVLKSPPPQVAVSESLTRLFLERPEQWTMAWTTLPEVYQQWQSLVPRWASSLTDPDQASAQLWPTLARYSLGYNLLVLEKVDARRAAALAPLFGDLWSARIAPILAAGNLFAIDMRVFESTEPASVDGFDRFTPATVTLLAQDPATKALVPVAVRVSGYKGAGAQIYSRETATAGAWLYALQAVKTSVTVYGIWLGHVYQWHIVSGAMQMTMYKNVPSDHPIYQLISPQSEYLIPLDDLFLLLWPHLTPPTSIDSALDFLSLCDAYGKGRGFFDDDPKTTLGNFGIEADDFTVDEPWDGFYLVRYLLDLWQASEQFVEAFVDATYADDQAVAGDQALQAWIAASGHRLDGNVRGLPAITGRQPLVRVLTSLVYRVTVHGTCRLNRVANPGLTFVANFPPCLQDATIPAPDTEIDFPALMRYLPNTGTIGGMVDFYFVFSFSVPYIPLVPRGGVGDELYFSDDASDLRNQALMRFRTAVMDFARQLSPECPEYYQWPRNVET